MSSFVEHTAGPSPWRAELRATVTLALPLIGTQLAQIATMTTDVVLLGRLGADALAAGALGANVVYVLITFTLGVLMAVSPMVAQAMGRKLHAVRDARRSVRQGLWVAVAVGVPCMIVIWHTEALLLLLGQDPANAALAAGYARAMMWGFLPGAGFMLLRFFVAALERPRPALVVMVLAVLLNGVLAWGLIFGRFGLPGLGVVGAGIATSIANTFSFVALLGFILVDRRLRRFHILGRLWRPDWRRFVELFRVGLPIGVILLIEVGLFSAAVQLMGLIGTAEIAAHQIALQCAAVAFMVPLGIGQAATVRIGLFAGAATPMGVQARRLGGARPRHRIHEHDGDADVDGPACAGRPVPRPRPRGECARRGAHRRVPRPRGPVPGVRRRAGDRARRAARPQGHARSGMLAAFGYWAVGFPVGSRAGLQGRHGRHRRVVGADDRADRRRRPGIGAFVRRERLGLVPRA